MIIIFPIDLWVIDLQMIPPYSFYKRLRKYFEMYIIYPLHLPTSKYVFWTKIGLIFDTKNRTQTNDDFCVESIKWALHF